MVCFHLFTSTFNYYFSRRFCFPGCLSFLAILGLWLMPLKNSKKESLGEFTVSIYCYALAEVSTPGVLSSY